VNRFYQGELAFPYIPQSITGLKKKNGGFPCSASAGEPRGDMSDMPGRHSNLISNPLIPAKSNHPQYVTARRIP